MTNNPTKKAFFMSELLETTNDYIKQLLDKKLPKTCIYHNYVHTQRVYKSTKEIVDGIGLNAADREVVLLAALLHDTGYTEGCELHEERSVAIAEAFLQTQNVSSEVIEKVSKTIMATKMESIPQNELEKILRGAKQILICLLQNINIIQITPLSIGNPRKMRIF